MKKPTTDDNQNTSPESSNKDFAHVDQNVKNTKSIKNPNNIKNFNNASQDHQNIDPQLSDQISELTKDLQRTRADFENYRKQVELQRAQAMSAAKYATVEKFLPLVDDFERAMSSYPDQLAPLAKSFEKTLTSLGLAKINSEPETEFNPDFHDAISIEDDDGDFEVISETLRPGYLYDGSVIRPAMVKVKRISK